MRRLIAKSAIGLFNPSILKILKSNQVLFERKNEDVQSYQNEKLGKILKLAHSHSTYYKKEFDKIGLFENNNLQIDRIKAIPILTKDIIRKYNEDIRIEPNKLKTYENTSGGSTGVPVTFVQDSKYYENNIADKLLFSSLNGKEFGDLEFKLWGSERDILEGTIGFREKLINFLYNREFLNSFSMDDKLMASYCERINKRKPVQIWSYADSIFMLSKFIVENKLSMYSPKNIITTAGMLHPDMRSMIQRAFPDTKILNQYGSREVGVIGIEIAGYQNEGIRVFDQSVYLEVIDEITGDITSEGKGKLLVTTLNNESMPLIRYEIGDVCELSRLSDSGIGGFSVIKKLYGRINCHFVTSAGEKIHGEYFTHLFYNRPWAKEFQVVQKKVDLIVIKIVLSSHSKPTEQELSEIDSLIYKVMGNGCSIEYQYMDQIPRLKSGKYQFVLSEV